MEIERLLEIAKVVSGTQYEKWLMEPILALRDEAEPLTRLAFVHEHFPNLIAVARLQQSLHKAHITSVKQLRNTPAADLAAMVGVGERQLLAACVVMEAYGYDDATINDWLDGLSKEPSRTRRAAVQKAHRKGSKRKHT